MDEDADDTKGWGFGVSPPSDKEDGLPWGYAFVAVGANAMVGTKEGRPEQTTVSRIPPDVEYRPSRGAGSGRGSGTSAAALVGKGRQTIPLSFQPEQTRAVGTGPLPAPPVREHAPHTRPIPFTLPTTVPEWLTKATTNGSVGGVLYAANLAKEAGVCVVVKGKVTMLQSTMLDTGSSLFFTDWDTFELLGLTPRPSHTRVRQVTGVSGDLEESEEDVHLVFAPGTQYETHARFEGIKWLRVSCNRAFRVLISIRALDQVGAIVSPALQAFAWYPGWARRDLSVLVSIPVRRAPTHEALVDSAASAGSARSEAVHTLQGVDWVGLSWRPFAGTAMHATVDRGWHRSEVWELVCVVRLWCAAAVAVLLRLGNDVEENPGP